MSGEIEARLRERGIELPTVAAPQGAYVPYTFAGNLIFLAGQLPMWDGQVQITGKVGGDISLEEGQRAARLCGLNLVAQVKQALGGDLDRVARVVNLKGFVNCPSDYTMQPKVVNGASHLMAEIFGETVGQHSRSAVGAGSLPLNIAVEVEGIVAFS